MATSNELFETYVATYIAEYNAEVYKRSVQAASRMVKEATVILEDANGLYAV
jgi:hypothetical protein